MAELERWEARFSEPGYLFGTEPNAFLKQNAHLLKRGQTALAIADGDGRNGVFMAGLGLEVLAVELSPTAIKKSRALAGERGVSLRFEQADLEAWSWPVDAFDVIVGIFFQFSAPVARAKIFEGVKRALKPGGLLLLEGYRTEQINYKSGGPSQPDRLYSRGLLEEAFAGFSSLAIEEHDSMMSEGGRHVGMAALIDLVGRK